VQGRVVDRLRSRYEKAGKATLFDALLPCLGGARGLTTQAAVGAGVGPSEGAMKVAVHRLRKEFGAVLRAEVGSTVAGEAEVDEEIRHLLRTTGGP
jgi:RNA polymerase sigma-70 factor (ECF subfamily)